MTTLLRQVLYTVASVTKQYKLVSSKAGSGTGTPRDALAPCPWTCSFSWCLAEG